MKITRLTLGIIKRLLVFLFIIAILTAGLFLFAWLRGPTTPEEPKTGSTILYYIAWAFILLLIYKVTDWVMKGKK
jgi:hypothetical protein